MSFFELFKIYTAVCLCICPAGDLCLCVSGCVRVVKAEGMPQYRNPFEKGDLYVKFDVQFPENNWIDAEKLNVSCPKGPFDE